MKYAVRHRYIDSNPVVNAERPKDQRTAEEKDFIQVLTEDQITALFDHTKEYEFKVLFQLALFSDARQGELFGLKWSDIDWQNSQIEIKRSYNGGRWYAPKSKGSYRRVDIGPTMLSELKRWKLKAFFCQDDDLIFPNNLGNPLNPDNTVRRHFNPALTAAKLPTIRFHDLRHYAAFRIMPSNFSQSADLLLSGTSDSS